MQVAALKGIEAEGWLEDPEMNQAMCFGSIPAWALDLANSLPVHAFSREVHHSTRSAHQSQLTLDPNAVKVHASVKVHAPTALAAV